MWTRARVSALLIAPGLAAGLTGCGAPSANSPTAETNTVTTTSASSASTSTSSAPTASASRAPATATSPTATSTTAETPRPPSPGPAPEPSAPRAPRQRFVCPRGGIAEAITLQRAVDEGHQPWRTSPRDVAAACTFPDGAVKVLGVNTYQVTRASTGQTVIVTEVQPVRRGPAGIWVVTKVTPN